VDRLKAAHQELPGPYRILDLNRRVAGVSVRGFWRRPKAEPLKFPSAPRPDGQLALHARAGANAAAMRSTMGKISASVITLNNV